MTSKPNEITLEDIKKFRVSGDEDGFCGCHSEIAAELGLDSPAGISLRKNEHAYLAWSSNPKDTLMEVRSASSDFSVVFVQEKGRADFFAVKYGKKSPVLDSMLIYRVSQLKDADRPRKFEIIWSEDGLKAGLLIHGRFHAVYDFENLTGYCRTTGCQIMNFGFKYCRKWTDSAINGFIENPKDHFPVLNRPTSKDQQDLFIKEYFKPTLRRLGYKGSGLDFCKDEGDHFSVIHLQNSGYSSQCRRLFFVYFGLVKKTDLKDPHQKKAGYFDLRASGRLGMENLLPEERKKQKFRDGSYYRIERDDSLSEFIHEFKTDFEGHALPHFEKQRQLLLTPKN